MNPSDFENPMLTRYALDDLPPAERDAVESWIRQNPALLEEVQGVQDLAEALRAQAPMHDLRLTPPQRARVLQGPPRRVAPAARFPRRTESPGMLPGLLRLAAALALMAGAYLLGRKHDIGLANPVLAEEAAPQPAVPNTESPQTPQTGLAAVKQSEPAAETAPSPTGAVEEPPAVLLAEEGAPVVIEPKVEAPRAAMPDNAPPETAEPDREVRLVGGPATEKKAPVQPVAVPGVTVSAGPALAFANTSRRALDRPLLQPRLIRPPVSADARQLSAKPLQPGEAKAQPEPPRRKPDLHIHAWSYETASCPWNPEHRLLRVSLQLPADQEAVALGSHEYPVEVQFDPNYVREFRRLGARYQPPAELRSAGSQTLWYEFLPNGAPAATYENGKLVATVRVPGAKFTTQAVGPFDASRLQVLDRGNDWREARGDFIHETAVVGLGLLLDGAAHIGGLNRKLVLELAQAAREEGDPDGSRARFINALRQLDRLTGR